MRAAAQTALLDAMLGALSANDPREAAAARTRRLWLTGGAVVTGLGGLAAAAAWSAAAHLFVLACLGQWTWLLVVAPLWVDPFDPPEAPGRRATRNAALGHTALTIAVLGAEAKLATWPELSWPIQTATAAAGAALVAFALYMLRQGVLAAPSKAGTQGNQADAADDAHDSPSPPDEE